MDRFLSIAQRFISDVRVQWMRGDPLLMGAAIAYNSLFALVPLAVAFTSLINLFDLSDSVLMRVVDLINATLPPDIAAFVIEIIVESSDVVGTDDTAVLVIALLVALWSGSRAVYAVQKSLRLIQGDTAEASYIRTRLTGIIVTVGAGLSVLIGYSMLLFGETAFQGIADTLGLPNIGLAQFLFWVLLAVWVYALLWVVYRFGPPRPVDHSFVVAAAVEAVLAAGVWFSFALLPADTKSVAATFGVMGVVLVLLYFIGVAIVATPVVVTAAWGVWTSAPHGYDSKDDGEAVEPEGSQERPEASR